MKVLLLLLASHLLMFPPHASNYTILLLWDIYQRVWVFPWSLLVVNYVFKSKPWITNDIKKSISIRDKLYKEIIKDKNVLTKVLKQTHYNKYFEENILYILSPKSKQGNISHHTHYWWRDIWNNFWPQHYRKSTGPNSIPTKVMKQIKDVISETPAKLINRSSHNGVFPNTL